MRVDATLFSQNSFKDDRHVRLSQLLAIPLRELFDHLLASLPSVAFSLGVLQESKDVLVCQHVTSRFGPLSIIERPVIRLTKKHEGGRRP